MPRLAIVGAGCVVALTVAAPSASGFGSLDNGFGAGGTLVLSVGSGGQSAGNGIALASGGALRVGGEAIDGGTSQFALLRLDANGTPASAATTLTPVGADAAAAAIVTGSDGRSLLAGYALGASGSVFGVARYLDGGSLDTAGFGAGSGTQQAAIGDGNDSAARAVAAYGADQFVAAGRALDGGSVKIALVRLQSDGSIDPGFNA